MTPLVFVSILVMMDLSFWYDASKRHVAPKRMFQSLLWWIYHFDFAVTFWPPSISCFNPCYDGFIILIHKDSCSNCAQDMFQSLLWWIYHFDRKPYLWVWYKRRKFQSLLWWIYHFDCSGWWHSPRRVCVSILVMMDLSFWFWCYALNFKRWRVSILVMMDLSFWYSKKWTWTNMTWVSILVMMDLSFWSAYSLNCWQKKNRVSILVMMDLSFWSCRHTRICRLAWSSVSILVMMDLSFWYDVDNSAWVGPVQSFNPCYDGFIILIHLPTMQSIREGRFNPCYDGFIILICAWGLCSLRRWLVSILVMMDLSFWSWRTSTFHPVQWVSILVMMDLSFWSTDEITVPSFTLCFNPCYDGFIILIRVFSKDTGAPTEFQSLLWWIYHFDPRHP